MMGIETGGTECVPATEGGSLTAVLPTCAFLAVCACLGETREAGVFKPRSGSLFSPDRTLRFNYRLVELINGCSHTRL